MDNQKFLKSIENIKNKYIDDAYIAMDMKKFVNDLIIHITSRKYFDKFIEKGGEISLVWEMGNEIAYNSPRNEISLDAKNFFLSKDKAKLSMQFSHECHHAYTSLYALENGINIANVPDYDEKSAQIIMQGMEIGAVYHEIVAGFENGNNDWDFIKSFFHKEAALVENILKNNNVKVGQAIPKKLLSDIADTVVIVFSKSLGLECKYNYIKTVERFGIDNFGNKKISCKKLFEIMECPTNFSEEQLLRNVLIDKEFIPHMPDRVKEKINIAESGINNQVEQNSNDLTSIAILAMLDRCKE